MQRLAVVATMPSLSSWLLLAATLAAMLPQTAVGQVNAPAPPGSARPSPPVPMNAAPPPQQATPDTASAPNAAPTVATPPSTPPVDAPEAPLLSALDVIRDSCKALPKRCAEELRQVVRERVDDPIDGAAQTPLMLAVLLARPLAVTTLLDMGADKSIASGDGRTPLHAAAETGNVEIAQVLLEAGDDPNHMAPDGFAPIHRACRGEGLGHTEVVELLLKHGVSVASAAANGKTPIELVRHNRDTRERLEHELRRHSEL